MDKTLENQILSKLKKHLTDMTDCSEEKITPNTVLGNDLKMDSLDKYEFAYGVEEDFKIYIPDGKIQDELNTVKDYMEYILNSEEYQEKS